jgi:hypothetical protein
MGLGTLNQIWYIFPVLVFCTKKNLATLVANGSEVSATKRRGRIAKMTTRQKDEKSPT